MAHEHNERCQALREALANARASQDPPHRDSMIAGIQGTTSLDPGDITPDASPQLKRDIEMIEQELRDMGCEPR